MEVIESPEVRLTDLIAAVESGDSENLRRLVSNRGGIDLDEPEPDSGMTPGWTLLHHAIVNRSPGSIDCVQILLDEHVNVFTTTPLGYNSAILAIRNGRSEVLKLLLDHCPDLQFPYFLGHRAYSPISYAICYDENQTGCLKVLVSGKHWSEAAFAIINREDASDIKLSANFHGESIVLHALSLAVHLHDKDCLKTLLEGGVVFQTQGQKMETDTSHISLTVMEFSSSPQPTKVWRRIKSPMHKNTPMFTAALRGYMDCLELISPSKPEESIHNQTPLHAAASMGNPECLRHLIWKDLFPINAQDDLGRTALCYACLHGNIECVQILLDVGAKYFNLRVRCPEQIGVMEAVMGHFRLCSICQDITFCANHGSKFSTSRVEEKVEIKCCENLGRALDNCGLHRRILNLLIQKAQEDLIGDVETLQAFLNEGLKPCILGNDSSERGSSTKERRKQRPDDRVGLLQDLLSAGADPHSMQISVLHWACKQKAAKCLDLLLSYGRSFCADKPPLDINQGDAKERRPISFAAMYGFEYGVTALLDAGCELNYVYNGSPSTEWIFPAVLGFLYSNRKMSVPKLLLSRGASASIPDDWNLGVLKKIADPSYILPNAKLALAAGYPRAKLLHVMRNQPDQRCRRKIATMTGQRDQHLPTVIDRFIYQLRRKKKPLQELCRDVIGRHLMAAHPDTNLFCLVPQLPIPQPIRKFLLYDIEL